LGQGFSLIGWSTSNDFGQSWTYRGQIAPPNGWSEFGADPSVAVDPSNPSTVYAVALAISDQRWANIPGATPAVSPIYPIPFVDSFCVATSFDAGQTFPAENVHCRQVSDLSTPATTDRTAAVVDGLGRIWVAVADVPSEDANTGVLRLFHSELGSPGTFTEVAPLPDGPYCRHQILRRDFDGNVWLGAMGHTITDATEHLYLVKYDILTNLMSVPSVIPDLGCGRTVQLVQDVFINSSLPDVRTAHSYDFDFGLNEPSLTGGGGGQPVLRYVWVQARGDGRQFVEVAEYPWNTTTKTITPTCHISTTSSTSGDTGNQFQPSINFTDRAGSPTWWIVYLTSAGVLDPTAPQLKPEAGLVTTTSNPAPQLTLRTELAPPNWTACPHGGYWGDYFSLVQLIDTSNTWWSVSSFSDSRPPPACNGTTPAHVAASRW
jgi:hypothetical protein